MQLLTIALRCTVRVPKTNIELKINIMYFNHTNLGSQRFDMVLVLLLDNKHMYNKYEMTLCGLEIELDVIKF